MFLWLQVRGGKRREGQEDQRRLEAALGAGLSLHDDMQSSVVSSVGFIHPVPAHVGVLDLCEQWRALYQCDLTG